jgi:hypothetical protein
MAGPSARYVERAGQLIRAVDIAAGVLADRPQDRNMVEFGEELKELTKRPPQTVAGLRYLESAFLTYWNESAGPQVDRFWELVAAEGLPFTTADLAEIRHQIRHILTNGAAPARKAMFEALIHEITIVTEDTVRPVFKLPLTSKDERLALNGPAPTTADTANQAVRALTTMVDLTTRYSNHPDELGQLRDLLKRIASGDQAGSPGLDGEVDRAPATQPRSPRKLADRLPADAVPTMISQFLDGTTVQALATRYGISRSSVKNILRRHGARRQS